MSVCIASLNSGSNGNCYYIGSSEEAVLIDAGLSARETLLRMQHLGLDAGKLKAIFISHEHIDHVSGLQKLHEKLKIPVYITAKTRRNCRLKLQSELVHSFVKNEIIQVGKLHITPFSKSHDANDPHSFVVSCHNLQVGVFTDIGYACEEVIHHFSKCDAAFLESNYCEKMLEEGNYPRFLKSRISGKNGHLSNQQALELFQLHRNSNVKLLLLSHLSKNNNSAETALELFKPHAGDVKIVVAGRDKATALYTLQAQRSSVNDPSPLFKQPPQHLSMF